MRFPLCNSFCEWNGALLEPEIFSSYGGSFDIYILISFLLWFWTSDEIWEKSWPILVRLKSDNLQNISKWLIPYLSGENLMDYINLIYE